MQSGLLVLLFAVGQAGQFDATDMDAYFQKTDFIH